MRRRFCVILHPEYYNVAVANFYLTERVVETMEYITGLFIYYVVANTNVFTVIWYESEKMCLEAMIDNGPLYIQLDAEAMLCKKTDKMSKGVPRPKIRPEGDT